MHGPLVWANVVYECIDPSPIAPPCITPQKLLTLSTGKDIIMLTNQSVYYVVVVAYARGCAIHQQRRESLVIVLPVT
jgi:hypothetical protein